MTLPTICTTREEWLNEFMVQAKPQFAAVGFPIPDKVRISIGFASTGNRGSKTAEIWSEKASADGHKEIFITPTTDSDARIADILTQALIRAVVGNTGFKGAYVTAARALGLEGKPTQLVAGEKWLQWALPILHKIGAAPYAPIHAEMDNGKKKQNTYLLKAYCPACEWGPIRVTKKHVEPYSHLNCPNPDCSGELFVDMD